LPSPHAQCPDSSASHPPGPVNVFAVHGFSRGKHHRYFACAGKTGTLQASRVGHQDGRLQLRELLNYKRQQIGGIRHLGHCLGRNKTGDFNPSQARCNQQANQRQLIAS